MGRNSRSTKVATIVIKGMANPQIAGPPRPELSALPASFTPNCNMEFLGVTNLTGFPNATDRVWGPTPAPAPMGMLAAWAARASRSGI
jgi:hypothetical protein